LEHQVNRETGFLFFCVFVLQAFPAHVFFRVIDDADYYLLGFQWRHWGGAFF